MNELPPEPRAYRWLTTLTLIGGSLGFGYLSQPEAPLWARWLEGFEAMRLENRFGKPALLEFYLNQVPYAGQRRGVVQAARHYFDREPDTLSPAEMLAPRSTRTSATPAITSVT